MQFLCHLFLFHDWRQSLHSWVPRQSLGTSQRTKKLHEPKTGKLHQSQQPSHSLVKLVIGFGYQFLKVSVFVPRDTLPNTLRASGANRSVGYANRDATTFIFGSSCPGKTCQQATPCKTELQGTKMVLLSIVLFAYPNQSARAFHLP